MAMLTETPSPIMGTPARFHPHAKWGQWGHKMPQFTAGEPLPEHHVSGVIHADDVQHRLRDVEAKYAYRVCHGTRLLRVNGCRRRRNHSGS
jgi:hypothetical protein